MQLYEPYRHCGSMTRPVDETKCRAETYDNTTRRFSQCSRKPTCTVDGIGLCKQHSPEEREKRRAAGKAKYEAAERRWAMGSYGEGFMAALVKIRDGDNDPRETARKALEKCRYAE